MYVGVVVLVIFLDGLKNGTRFLRGGGVIKVNQRMAVDLLRQSWKVIADRFGDGTHSITTFTWPSSIRTS